MSAVTDEGYQALKVLEIIFNDADKELTGNVKAKFLIEPLSKSLHANDKISEREVKMYVKELAYCLDPRGDNVNVFNLITLDCF